MTRLPPPPPLKKGESFDPVTIVGRNASVAIGSIGSAVGLIVTDVRGRPVFIDQEVMNFMMGEYLKYLYGPDGFKLHIDMETTEFN